MFAVRYAVEEDIIYWRGLDPHITEAELRRKIAGLRGYVLENDHVPIGVMRYNLFWDSIPCLTMMYFEAAWRRKGCGTLAMRHWEKELCAKGYRYAMISTQADEEAQFFYRKMGYKDNGCLFFSLPGIEQPPELMMIKQIRRVDEDV